MRPKGKPINWSSDIAYAVGLITTDGNLSSDKRHMCLVSNDLQLIETFKKCLNINNKISKKYSAYTKEYSSYVVQFGNVILYQWLLKIGLMPNKSKIIGPLKIPDKYFFHFLRGHLDGDGNISRYMDSAFPKSERLYLRFYCASIKHLEWLKAKINKLENVNGYIQAKHKEYELVYAKKDSLKLLKKIYPNNNIPCLLRKRKIVESFL